MARTTTFLILTFCMIAGMLPQSANSYCQTFPPAFEKIYIRSPCEVLFTPNDKFYRSPCGTLRPFDICGTDCYGYYIIIVNSICPNCGRSHRGNQPLEGYSCDLWEAPKTTKQIPPPPIRCPTGVPGGLPLLTPENTQKQPVGNEIPEINNPPPLIRSAQPGPNSSAPVLTPIPSQAPTQTNPPPLNRSSYPAPVLTPVPTQPAPQPAPSPTPEPVLKRGYA